MVGRLEYLGIIAAIHRACLMAARWPDWAEQVIWGVLMGLVWGN